VTANGGETEPVEVAATSTEPPDGDQSSDDGGADFVLQLPAFEGPLDLLLHLIEREELDITELSVLQVTEQYLAHLRAGEQINLGALADFVAMGARLLVLKSRSLLPGEEEEHDSEEIDDATDLVNALQEYRRYRRVAEQLRELEDEQRTAYRRDAAPPDVPLPTGLDDVTLDGLMTLFRDVLERLPEEKAAPELQREPIRLADRVSALMTELGTARQLSFRSLIGRAESRIEVIVDFMAVLELIKARFLEARQPTVFGEIEMVRLDGATPTTEEIEEAIDES
jgi:segregation and condensation protein A